MEAHSETGMRDGERLMPTLAERVASKPWHARADLKEAARRIVESSCREQGLEAQIADPVVIGKVASILRVGSGSPIGPYPSRVESVEAPDCGGDCDRLEEKKGGGLMAFRVEPAVRDEDAELAEALVAVRRAATCVSLPSHARRALEAGADVLARYAPQRSLTAVRES